MVLVPTPNPVPLALSNDQIEWCVKAFRLYSCDLTKVLRAWPFQSAASSRQIRDLYLRMLRVERYEGVGRDDPDMPAMLIRHRCQWQEDEKTELLNAVKKFGPQWRLIQRNARGTCIERFNDRQLMSKWRSITRAQKRDRHRKFQLLDVVDQEGNAFTYTATFVSYAALKAAKLGLELVRLREHDNDVVHVFKAVFLPTITTVFKICIEDPHSGDFRPLTDFVLKHQPVSEAMVVNRAPTMLSTLHS